MGVLRSFCCYIVSAHLRVWVGLLSLVSSLNKPCSDFHFHVDHRSGFACAKVLDDLIDRRCFARQCQDARRRDLRVGWHVCVAGSVRVLLRKLSPRTSAHVRRERCRRLRSSAALILRIVLIRLCIARGGWAFVAGQLAGTLLGVVQLDYGVEAAVHVFEPDHCMFKFGLMFAPVPALPLLAIGEVNLFAGVGARGPDWSFVMRYVTAPNGWRRGSGRHVDLHETGLAVRHDGGACIGRTLAQAGGDRTRPAKRAWQ